MTETEKDREKQEERERKIKIKRGVRERLRVRKVHKEFHFNNNNKQDIEVNCMIVKKIQVVCSVGLGKLSWGSWTGAAIDSHIINLLTNLQTKPLVYIPIQFG